MQDAHNLAWKLAAVLDGWAPASLLPPARASDAGHERVRAAIEAQAEHFDMPGLQLGFCYATGALLRGEGEAPPEFQVRELAPTGCPGAVCVRLDHVLHLGRPTALS